MLKSADKKKDNGFGPALRHPLRIEAEPDPIVQLGVLFNLEEVLRLENPPLRVLRCNRSGVSIYVRPPVPHAAGTDRPCRYVVAYEGEVSVACHVKQILIQSNDPASVWSVLSLVERQAHLLHEKFRARTRPGRFCAEDLERMAGSRLSRMRKNIHTLLAAVSEVEPGQDAYDGFINAVVSLTDENIDRPLGKWRPEQDLNLRPRP